MEINLQMLSVSHDPQRLLGSGYRHVQSLQVGEEAYRLDGLHVFHCGPNARENDNIALSALECIDRADLHQFEVLLESRSIDGGVDSAADLMHLGSVGRNNSDRIADHGRRQSKKESMDEIRDEICLAGIMKRGAMFGAQTLQMTQIGPIFTSGRSMKAKEGTEEPTKR